ncbi:MAG: GGDEF domain-containing protein [Myxococcales bacterium]|nr:GGDEF domain-containing protein [Myxococcales bacterium]
MKALAETSPEYPSLSTPPSPLGELQTALDGLIAENRALREELAQLRAFRKLAYRDPLTGLWNRRYFDERLAEEISRGRRKLDYRFSILLVDVNDLKLVNDNDGHAAGDALLRWVSRFLQSATRAHDLVCRLGGDEFGILLPDCSPLQAHAVQARLREALAAENERHTRAVGMSLGTATCPDGGPDPEALLRAADAAMYADKRRQKAGRPLAVCAP